MQNMQPLAVTVLSPAYEKVGKEAADRMTEFGGLPVKVLRCKDGEGFATKLQLDKLCGRRPVVFFDADWWMLRPQDLRAMVGGPTFLGCHDPTVFHEHCFPFKDCRDHGLDWQRYVNTGFFMVDFRRAEHRAIFGYARRSWARRKKLALHDPTDQYHINLGLLKAGVPFMPLPRAFNFFLFAATEGCCEIPREIIGLHGAGVETKHKLKEMKHQAHVFGSRPVLPMRPGAIQFHYALTHQLR